MKLKNTLFDTYIAVDWSARNVPTTKKPSADALWVAIKQSNSESSEHYFRTRYECIQFLLHQLELNVKEGRRVIIGYDLDFGFPYGFVNALVLTGQGKKWEMLWQKLSEMIIDNQDNSNNRFEVAAKLNSMINSKDKQGPLWGCPVNLKLDYLKPKSPKFPFRVGQDNYLEKFRWTEKREARAQPSWKLIGSASVGGQTLVGIPAVYKLRNHTTLKSVSKIWPFETGFIKNDSKLPQILHIEIWPGILSRRLNPKYTIKDQAQVNAVANWLFENDLSGNLLKLLAVPKDLSSKAQRQCIEEEGWIIGMGSSSNSKVI